MVSSRSGAADLDLEVREFRKDDVGFLEDLTSRLFLAYGSYERYLLDWLGRSDVLAYVAESRGTRLGFFMVQFPGEPTGGADLIAIAVEPKHQSRGVGSALLARCLSVARERLGPGEPAEVRLSVADGNARAQRLFSRYGFRLGQGVGVYPAGQRALLMVKSLVREER